MGGFREDSRWIHIDGIVVEMIYILRSRVTTVAPGVHSSVVVECSSYRRRSRLHARDRQEHYKSDLSRLCP